MTLTDRDRKIVMVLVPLVLVAGYWFLVLSPKKNEAAGLGDKLSQAESRRDDAQAAADRLETSKRSYARDYETVVRLGKAIPSTLDMPSLIVQLDDAAKGTGIKFKKVMAGDRNAAPAPPPPPSTTQGGQGGNASAGGQQASTTAGKATEKANGAATASDNANAAAGADPGTASGTPGAQGTSGVSGLDSVPLDFSFSGSFFDLADFFHRMKRFVRVVNKDIRVQGRLMTIDTLNFRSDTFPVINAEVKATVYLSPKAQGATAGASPAGPATATPVGTQPAPAPSTAPVAQNTGTPR